MFSTTNIGGNVFGTSQAQASNSLLANNFALSNANIANVFGSSVATPSFASSDSNIANTVLGSSIAQPSVTFSQPTAAFSACNIGSNVFGASNALASNAQLTANFADSSANIANVFGTSQSLARTVCHFHDIHLKCGMIGRMPGQRTVPGITFLSLRQIHM